VIRCKDTRENAGAIRYEILGPIPLVRSGERIGAVGAHKIETLLATLLIQAGQVVTTDRLINEIWGLAPPRTAVAALHVYVSKLRKMLAGLGAGNPVVTRPSGYLLDLGKSKLDLRDFLELVDEARLLARQERHVDVIDRVDRALALCTATVVGDCFGGPIITNFSAWITATRLECVGLAATANLALCRHDEVISALYPVLAEHPLHEPFCGQLMRALYLTNRRADALKVYDTLRTALQAELGLEPCLDLRELHDAILDT
jgi:DNA-binding SARP family transcriptional activator